MSRVLWILALCSALLFVALAVISKAYLELPGHVIFDSRVGGYSVAEAREYLSLLTPEQVALYLGRFRQIDTLFPILLSLTLMGLIWSQAAASQFLLRLFASLTPLAYLALDLSENAAVAHLLTFGPNVSESAILQASNFTVSKWISLALAGMMAVWAWRLSPRLREEA